MLRPTHGSVPVTARRGHASADQGHTGQARVEIGDQAEGGILVAAQRLELRAHQWPQVVSIGSLVRRPEDFKSGAKLASAGMMPSELRDQLIPFRPLGLVERGRHPFDSLA